MKSYTITVNGTAYEVTVEEIKKLIAKTKERKNARI